MFWFRNITHSSELTTKWYTVEIIFKAFSGSSWIWFSLSFHGSKNWWLLDVKKIWCLACRTINFLNKSILNSPCSSSDVIRPQFPSNFQELLRIAVFFYEVPVGERWNGRGDEWKLTCVSRMVLEECACGSWEPTNQFSLNSPRTYISQGAYAWPTLWTPGLLYHLVY